MGLARALEVAVAAARAAGALLLEDFARAGGARGHGDKAEADVVAERLIRGRLQDAFPDWGYHGEETGSAAPAPGRSRTWRASRRLATPPSPASRIAWHSSPRARRRPPCRSTHRARGTTGPGTRCCARPAARSMTRAVARWATGLTAGARCSARS